MRSLYFLFFFLVIILGFFPGVSYAHRPSDGYLSLAVENARIVGRLDLAVKDLDFLFDLDTNDDYQIVWRELEEKREQIVDYLRQNLELKTGDTLSTTTTCATTIGKMLIDQHLEEPFAVFIIDASCAGIRDISTLTVNYSVLFKFDPQHRGILKVTGLGPMRTSVLSPEQRSESFDKSSLARGETLMRFLKEGIWHIWIGYDHILFILSLLLPAVLVYKDKRWEANNSPREIFQQVLYLVTSFTIAHSITLSLAGLNIISLSSRLVESAIALSVAVVAANNIWPVFDERKARYISFCFGLVHGFGFASVLSELGLDQGNFILSVLSFNVGVELGQLAILLVYILIAYQLRKLKLYQYILKYGSAGILLIATYWFIQRAF